jgi:enoyl-CoA hydratase
VAITGGFELALACDVLIASTRARFADTPARVGIMPGWGLSQKLSRLIGPYRAKELSLSGNFIDADTASRWGLVNRVIGPDDLMPAARALARDMAQLDGKTLAGMKHLIDTGYGLGLREALEFEGGGGKPATSRAGSGPDAARRRGVTGPGRRGCIQRACERSREILSAVCFTCSCSRRIALFPDAMHIAATTSSW